MSTKTKQISRKHVAKVHIKQDAHGRLYANIDIGGVKAKHYLDRKGQHTMGGDGFFDDVGHFFKNTLPDFVKNKALPALGDAAKFAWDHKDQIIKGVETVAPLLLAAGVKKRGRGRPRKALMPPNYHSAGNGHKVVYL